MRQGLATHWSLLLFILNFFLCTPFSSRLCGEDIAPADWMTIPRCWSWDTAYERSQPRSGRRTNCATRRHPPWTTSFDINTSPTFWRPWKTLVRLCQFWLFTHMSSLLHYLVCEPLEALDPSPVPTIILRSVIELNKTNAKCACLLLFFVVCCYSKMPVLCCPDKTVHNI